ncbi:pentapeptide repeat-containing protein [Halosquirtibacter laminarini]|uniref:Pentapeptide repeat-containing protein n=2 Tax=Halosquirtibacter laminarini TaxID=3374600 RepID=A0AC61NBJ8_9BACT|nr:pentapeptide repeat-containing protein [Prolixibacteraceae bacterium]
MNSLILNGYEFEDCEFIGCDLSLVNLSGSAFRNVTFRECLLQGVAFNHANPFLLAFHFDHCRLDQSQFIEMDLRNCSFRNAKVREAIFESCNMQKVAFDRVDLGGTFFDRCNLMNADFRSAEQLALDPEQNRVKGARFSYQSAIGLLTKYQIKVSH